MPSSPNYKRNYKQEYKNQQSSTKAKKDRAQRNSARATMVQAGLARKGDGKDVDHKQAISKGGGNSKSNLRVVSASKNRSYKRTSKGAMK